MNRALPSSTPRQTHPHWMLTFGDLLTLLLCFFLATFSLGRAHVMENAKNIEELAPMVGPPAPGTGLAPTRAGIERVKFGEDDFFPAEDALSAASVKRLSQYLREVLTSSASTPDVLIETCVKAPSVYGESAWRIAKGRALYLQRELTALSSRPLAIKVRVLGAACAGLAESEDNEVVSRITVSFS